MIVPPSLAWLGKREDGRAWLADLPRLLEAACGTWDLRLGDVFEGSHVSYVASARRGEERLVLKIQFPHPECTHEAAALRRWDGQGAIRLIDEAPDIHALLLEACDPGLPLGGHPDPMPIVGEILDQLLVGANPPFTPLAEEAAGWAGRLFANWEADGRPCPRRMVEAAQDWIGQLTLDQPGPVLLHQDLHGDNILSARRSGAPVWLAIDPKPLAGDPAFAPSPILRSFELGEERADLLHRLNYLTERLSLDRQRVIGWAIAQGVAWSFGSNHREKHLQSVSWLIEAM